MQCIRASKLTTGLFFSLFSFYCSVINDLKDFLLSDNESSQLMFAAVEGVVYILYTDCIGCLE